ncbi:MAG: pyrroline-5-carboxylate reductase [Nitrospirae bacterium]|nr:pyrroline-5-carboxylate reductase [Nitrospirota bacterium]
MIGFIGGGNMAEALIKGIKDQSGGALGSMDIFVSDPSSDRRLLLEKNYGVRTTASNTEVAAACDIIILAVKPQNMDAVLGEIAGLVDGSKTVVSIAAGITLSFLASKLKTDRLIRVMPNTPALVQEGMSVLSVCDCFAGKEMDTVRSIFMSVGTVLTLPEKYMDSVTALSGSGPGFMAFFVEALTEGGEKMGLSGSDASELAVQTFIGTAKLLSTGMSPEKLRRMVTSPGGTTEAGLKTFSERDFFGVVEDALRSARARAEELGRGR